MLAMRPEGYEIDSRLGCEWIITKEFHINIKYLSTTLWFSVVPGLILICNEYNIHIAEQSSQNPCK